MARYPIDQDGKLIEIVIDGPLPPDAAGEADGPPAEAGDRWNGEAWVPDLAATKARARVQISAAAEAARLQFVTPGSGKAMAYQEKASEAARFFADPDPQPANYPLLTSEIGISAAEEEGLAGVAAVVAGKYQLFRQIEAAIGGTEAAAQKRVKEATDVGTIQVTLDSLVWPSAD